jgi:hypothetical protein
LDPLQVSAAGLDLRGGEGHGRQDRPVTTDL